MSYISVSSVPLHVTLVYKNMEVETKGPPSLPPGLRLQLRLQAVQSPHDYSQAPRASLLKIIWAKIKR